MLCILLTICVGALYHQLPQVHTQETSPALAVEHSRSMMEKVVFGYSLKNISIPGKQEYILRLTHSVSHFINRLRWRAFFFLNPDEGGEGKETFGLKSLKPAPAIEGLKEFEGKFIDLIQSVETKRPPSTCEMRST